MPLEATSQCAGVIALLAVEWLFSGMWKHMNFELGSKSEWIGAHLATMVFLSPSVQGGLGKRRHRKKLLVFSSVDTSVGRSCQWRPSFVWYLGFFWFAKGFRVDWWKVSKTCEWHITQQSLYCNIEYNVKKVKVISNLLFQKMLANGQSICESWLHYIQRWFLAL